MDIIADVEGAFARVEAHIKNLLDNGAAHQKPIANDMKTVFDCAQTQALPDMQTPQIAQLQADLATANAKIANLQSHVDAILVERDSLKLALVGANADVLRIEAELAAAKNPLSTAAEATGGRVAE